MIHTLIQPTIRDHGSKREESINKTVFLFLFLFYILQMEASKESHQLSCIHFICHFLQS